MLRLAKNATNKPESFTPAISTKYRIALGLIAVLSCVAYLSLSAVIEEEENSAAIVNLSGRQRMLSQRIVLLARELIDSKDSRQFSAYKLRLEGAIGRMEAAHNELVHNHKATGTPALSSPIIKDIYFSHPYEADRWVHNFLEHAKSFANTPPQSLSLDNPDLQFISHVAPGLLTALDAAVTNYEAQSNEKVERIIQVERGVLGFTLMVLLLEALFIFQPMVQQIKTKADELVKSRRRFKAIASSLSESLIVTDRSMKILFTNPSTEHLLGWKHDELQDSFLDHIIQIQNAEGTSNFSWAVKNNPAGHKNEILLLHKNGSEIPAEYSVTQLFEDSKITGYVITLIDISERKRHQDQIKHMAYHDSLTNLPNRRLFLDRLNHELARAKREQTSLGIMFLDLDGFKNINDSLGHDTGDIVLKTVSTRIQSQLRECDTIARHGGDEFILLLTGLDNRENASTIAEKIIEAVRHPIRINDTDLFINTSIGISLFPTDSDSGEALITKADCAMYCVKNKGRNGYALCANLRANSECAMSCSTH